ncbi:hypothetical protein K1719_044004 [Acacia pycnantha]|nr:hypothetical protein K1719_044004 [Acacia pycnantha]
MGDEVKWPPKTNKPVDQRYRSKWCEFYSDHGHWTAYCFALKLEVVELLNSGHLTDLVSKTCNGLSVSLQCLTKKTLDQWHEGTIHPSPSNKVPDRLGVQEIKEEHRTTKECYQATLEPADKQHA